MFVLSTLAFTSVAGGKYGEKIKEKPEYKKITEPKRDDDDDDSDSGGGYYYYHDHDPYYGPSHSHSPAVVSHTESAPAPAAGPSGLVSLGIAIGDSEFDYDDIDDGDARLFRIGYQVANSHLGYEFSFFDSGETEVTSLEQIEIEVDTINLALTYNSSRNNRSTWNLVAGGGIYFADFTLSGPADRVSEASNGFMLLAAAEIMLNRNFALRAEAYHFIDVEDFVDDESVTYLGVGGLFVF